jgi:predicted transcriptional regulator
VADHALTINIPDQLYARLTQLAEATSQPVEEIAVKQLSDAMANVDLLGLPADEQAELSAFKQLSEATLRSIAREQTPITVQQRMIDLGDKLSRGKITQAEHDEYKRLVEQGERLMLRKAWAANILMERGHSITSDDYTANDE